MDVVCTYVPGHKCTGSANLAGWRMCEPMFTNGRNVSDTCSMGEEHCLSTIVNELS